MRNDCDVNQSNDAHAMTMRTKLHAYTVWSYGLWTTHDISLYSLLVKEKAAEAI